MDHRDVKDFIGKFTTRYDALIAVREILSLNIAWKDDWFISDKDLNEVREKDTKKYWEKMNEEIECSKVC